MAAGTGERPQRQLRAALLLAAGMVTGVAVAAAPATHAEWGANGGDDGNNGWDNDWEDNGWDDDPWGDEEAGGLPFELSGFAELAGGYRTRDHELFDKRYHLAEARLRLEARGDWRRFDYRVRADAVADGVTDELRGELREARLSFPVGERLDMRLGRQVLAWGTGDLLFINDLFPKDFQSFLTGRDEDYLQGPSDAVRGTWYGEQVTLDLVWTPLFAPDTYPEGERLSYFNPRSGEQVVDRLRAEEPDDFPNDGELAAQLRTRIGGTELAGYFYRGFFPQPGSVTEADRLTHGRLNAFGASLRDRLGPGIVNAEIGYYHSVDYDSSAPQRAPNSEARLLLGYTWEAITHLDVGLQYYVEWLQEYDELKAAWQGDENLDNAQEDDYRPDEFRHLLTARLTYSMWRDNLTASLFTFYSPSDNDYYLRPSLRYRASDALTYSLGGNFFGGDHAHTFFGQFTEDSNLYARLRYRF
ncbi:hypothetical protein CKO15_00930 [Halorhodospira abdelmalekii]|uniref:DUF1302 family protein n=1 Tax=Halorhodospira abdelmalekii TaxID=421629 RepID=UPI0019069091|nr:DUF1302 family protein [Halorhodospira abdelmalekii]MBK1733864.1 hypothetical protein [Halorhodospira abdelmalekii]